MLVGMVVITVNKQDSYCQYYHLFHRVSHTPWCVGSVKQISILPKVTLVNGTSLCGWVECKLQNAARIESGEFPNGVM